MEQPDIGQEPDYTVRAPIAESIENIPFTPVQEGGMTDWNTYFSEENVNTYYKQLNAMVQAPLKFGMDVLGAAIKFKGWEREEKIRLGIETQEVEGEEPNSASWDADFRNTSLGASLEDTDLTFDPIRYPQDYLGLNPDGTDVRDYDTDPLGDDPEDTIELPQLEGPTAPPPIKAVWGGGSPSGIYGAILSSAMGAVDPSESSHISQLHLDGDFQADVMGWEGFVANAYSDALTVDDKQQGLLVGYGHSMADVRPLVSLGIDPEAVRSGARSITRAEARKILEYDIKLAVGRARGATGNEGPYGFDKLPRELQNAIVDSTFRGAWVPTNPEEDPNKREKGSPATIALLQQGKFEEAAIEVMNRTDIREAKENDQMGIIARTEVLAKALRNAAEYYKVKKDTTVPSTLSEFIPQLLEDQKEVLGGGTSLFNQEDFNITDLSPVKIGDLKRLVGGFSEQAWQVKKQQQVNDFNKLSKEEQQLVSYALGDPNNPQYWDQEVRVLVLPSLEGDPTAPLQEMDAASYDDFLGKLPISTEVVETKGEFARKGRYHIDTGGVGFNPKSGLKLIILGDRTSKQAGSDLSRVLDSESRGRDTLDMQLIYDPSTLLNAVEISHKLYEYRNKTNRLDKKLKIEDLILPDNYKEFIDKLSPKIVDYLLNRVASSGINFNGGLA